jgi:hypothetical protein
MAFRFQQWYSWLLCPVFPDSRHWDVRHLGAHPPSGGTIHRHYSGISLCGLRNTTKKMDGVTAEKRTGHIPNAFRPVSACVRSRTSCLFFRINLVFCYAVRSRRYRNWLRHYSTSRKVAGSIPDEVIGFFNWHNPSSRTMAPGPGIFLGVNGGLPHEADNLTAICEPIV